MNASALKWRTALDGVGRFHYREEARRSRYHIVLTVSQHSKSVSYVLPSPGVRVKIKGKTTVAHLNTDLIWHPG